MGLRYTAGFDGYDAYANQAHNYDVEIYDVNYEGEPKEITMGGFPMEAEYSNSGRDSFPTLIPSFLNLNLVATESFQLNEMYTDDEKALKVIVKMDGAVYGSYFVIPDGTSESFIDPPYDVSVRCTDGLGILDGYDYPEVNGKASVLEAVAKCLNQLSLGMNINTYSDIHYSGLAVGQDVFLKTLINQEQFANNNEEPMNCNKVLESLLSEWVCGLVQMGGEWYLFRWPDVVRNNGNITFKKHDSNLNPIGDNTLNIDKVLGNGTGDVIHCRADQIRAVNMPYKRVSIKYEYGFYLNLVDSATAHFTGNAIRNFSGWEKNNGINAIPVVFQDDVAVIHGRTNLSSENRSITTKEPIMVYGLSKMRLELTFNAGTANGIAFTVALIDGGMTRRLTWDDKWGTGQTNNSFSNFIQHENGDSIGLGQTIRARREFNLPDGLTPSAYIRISFFPPVYNISNTDETSPGMVLLYDMSISAVSNSRSIVSETHTVVNDGNYTKVPDTIETTNGETNFYGYKGTMYKSDGITLTDGFKHRNESTRVDFLELAARDILFQHGRPMNRYEGSVLGVFGFLSRFAINSLDGKFMPVSMRVDFKSCISNVVMSEVSNDVVPHTVNPVIYEYDDAKQEGVKSVQ